jgi:hypothetical protein
MEDDGSDGEVLFVLDTAAGAPEPADPRDDNGDDDVVLLEFDADGRMRAVTTTRSSRSATGGT